MADHLSLAVDILAADREFVDEHVLGHHAHSSSAEAMHAAHLARAFRPGLTALESRYTTQTATLALQMTAGRGRIVAHTLRQTAIDRVHSTDLHALPPSPPRLLDGPWIIEVNEPLREQLWSYERGPVIAVAGHVTDDGLWLSVLEPQRRSTGVWTPSWGGTDDEIIDGIGGNLVLAAGNESAAPHHRAMMEQAVRFSLVLGAMLDAEGTPLRVRDEERARPRGGCGRRGLITCSGPAGEASNPQSEPTGKPPHRSPATALGGAGLRASTAAAGRFFFDGRRRMRRRLRGGLRGGAEAGARAVDHTPSHRGEAGPTTTQRVR